MKRASARWSAGSISLRSAASEARRSRRSTSGSHHSRCVPPGRSSPRTSSPARSSPASTGVRSSAVALAQLAPSRTGRACAPSGARAAPSRPARRPGTPPAGRTAAPRRARRGSSPASSAATQRSSPSSAQADRAALAARAARATPRRRAGRGARRRLLEREVADAAQHVVQRVDGVRARALGGALQVGLDLLERVRVDQLAQLLLAEQLAQQVAVERQRGGAALGVGRVALVHVGRDVVEQQRGGERRGGRRLDLDQARARASAACAAGPAGPGTSSTSRRHSR